MQKSFLISLALHLGILAFFISGISTPTESLNDLMIDVVTHTPAKVESKKVTAIAASQKQSTPQTVENSESAPSNEPKEITGESEVNSTLQGRAPINETEKYLVELQSQIARAQIYPPPSLAFREEGTVKVRLTLNRSGSLIKVELIEESPFKRLNDAAMKAATRAFPFRPFPNEVSFETWRITLPIRFTLAQK